MTTATKSTPHGTVTGYFYRRCRCDQCRQAANTWNSNRSRRIAYGTWQPLVDAEPARQHVRTLTSAGIGWERVAELADVPAATLERLLYGRPAQGDQPSRRIRPETEAKILALKPSPNLLPDGAQIDATGTRRRAQALAAAGWPAPFLGQQLGKARSYVEHFYTEERVYLRTARAVADLYDRLRDVDPLSLGVSPNSAGRARAAAKRAGWLPPQAWDGDIDDPAADPLAVGPCDEEPDCGPVPLTRAEKIAAARSMTLRGDTAARIAAELGVAARTVQRWRKAGGWKAA